MMSSFDESSQPTLPAATFYALWSSGPAPPWELRTAAYLLDRGYTVEQVRDVLDLGWAEGSVEACTVLDADAHAFIEDLLPEIPADYWNLYPDRWVTTEASTHEDAIR
jgi:hypothetical protein